jgi:2-oxoisovalerate dehydrogenase E1 component beta subunit
VSDYTLPLSKIETLIPGSDLTLLSYGTPLYTCETALSLLSSPPPELDNEHMVPNDVRKAKVELIDLRTILPWDMEGVIESVNRTGRLVIVHEAGKMGGVGAEIAAEVQKRCFLRLEAPVKRVCGWE